MIPAFSTSTSFHRMKLPPKLQIKAAAYTSRAYKQAEQQEV